MALECKLGGHGYPAGTRGVVSDEPGDDRYFVTVADGEDFVIASRDQIRALG